ncbi:lysozyme inhibitor LprI family protein [Devosia albogilva]|uniref:Lysozyme inhibitor LprI family protein n=1 Tax=Devosia albogilva TaxID=429726 RepID=A0ABW5QNR6_9HYPH
MKALVCAAMLVLFATTEAHPSDAVEHETCIAESGGVTVAMLACIGNAIDRSQAMLDALLDQHRPQLTPDQASALTAAQRDWRAYRQSTCDAAATLWGDGSFTSVVHAECWLELTRTRLDWLQSVLAKPT